MGPTTPLKQWACSLVGAGAGFFCEENIVGWLVWAG